MDGNHPSSDVSTLNDTAPEAGSTAPPRRRRRWPWAVGIGAVLLLCALVASLLTSEEPAEEATPAEPTAPSYGGPDLTHVWDYEDGTTDAWSEVHQLRTDQMRVLSEDDLPGATHVAEFNVKPGDTGWNGTEGTLRSEVRASIEESGSPTNGTEQWWAWSTYFPKNFDWDEKNQFLYFTQWHQTANSGNPNMGLWSNVDEELQLNVKGGSGGKKSGDAEYAESYSLDDLVKGEWNDFVVHVIWSDDPDEGLVEVWHNGKRVHSANDANLYEDQSVYVKQGIYSAAGTKHQQVIKVGPLRLGETRDSVE